MYTWSFILKGSDNTRGGYLCSGLCRQLFTHSTVVQLEPIFSCSWNQILLSSGTEWPLYSLEELNQTWGKSSLRVRCNLRIHCPAGLGTSILGGLLRPGQTNRSWADLVLVLGDWSKCSSDVYHDHAWRRFLKRCSRFHSPMVVLPSWFIQILDSGCLG